MSPSDRLADWILAQTVHIWRNMQRQLCALSALLATTVACSGGGSRDGAPDAGMPDAGPTADAATEPLTACEERDLDARKSGKSAFTSENLRWSCREVGGLGPMFEQEEYCEFFAIAKAPPAMLGESEPPASVHGRNLGGDNSFGKTPVGLALTGHQIQILDADPDAVVGQCVFTAWNSDAEVPCTGACEALLDQELTEDNFRMKFEVNSLFAAELLVEDCLYGYLDAVGDFDDPDDPRHIPFFRGCLYNEDVNETSHRKSDTTICSASVRLGECGCWIGDPENEPDRLPEVLAGSNSAGFPLGGWSGFVVDDPGASELPGGCRYIDFGPTDQRAVACDITATELIAGAPDLEQHCRATYADNIVVHIPIPSAELSCFGGDSSYSDTCTSEPWLL